VQLSELTTVESVPSQEAVSMYEELSNLAIVIE